MIFYTNVHARGNYIYLRGYKNNKRLSQKIEFKPTLYVTSKKDVDTRTLWGTPVEPIQFENIREARNFIQKYKDVRNFPIFGNLNFVYQFISKTFTNDIEYDLSQLRIMTIDIETSTEYGFPDPRQAQEEVLLITVKDFNTKKVTTFGCKPYIGERKHVTYNLCNDEFDLLRQFINFFKSNYPDIITGWNCQLFDVAYLSSRIQRVLGDKALEECSPWGIITNREIPFARGRTQLAFDWAGISILDYMDLYKKFSYKMQENYKLDTIAKEELGKEKTKHTHSTFREFYTKDWNLFVDYNITDVELVDELEDKMKLIDLILTMAYDAKCNYTDIFSSVRTWDCILYNILLKNNVIVHNPPDVDASADRTILGAYVKEPKPGKYDWVVSFDATSLYPSIMMTFNLSPETLVDGKKYLSDDEKSIEKLLNKELDTTFLKDNNLTMAANGQCFRKDAKGVLPKIIEYYFSERQKSKVEMINAQKLYEETKNKKYLNDVARLNSKQMAAKILMNSLYGAMGNIYFRYYDIRIAEGITMSGQLIIRSVAKKLNEYVNKISGTEDEEYSFYSDTDSTYITLNKLVERFFKDKTSDEIVHIINKICNEKISVEIDSTCDDLADYLNVFQKKITFKREVIADRGIWLAKKRYALNVHNAEGVSYNPPKLKVLGMEIVRSSTPGPVRKSLKEAVSIVLTKTEKELRDYVAATEEHWNTLSPEDIAFPRSVNGVKEYSDSNSIFRKGTPIHVRGALIYNQLINVRKLDKKYERIQEGDKIKFIYLKEPNPLGSHVISFSSRLPEEFSLQKYVDYSKMFEKSFLEPLNSLLTCTGWSLKEKSTLDELFA